MQCTTGFSCIYRFSRYCTEFVLVLSVHRVCAVTNGFRLKSLVPQTSTICLVFPRSLKNTLFYQVWTLRGRPTATFTTTSTTMQINCPWALCSARETTFYLWCCVSSPLLKWPTSRHIALEIWCFSTSWERLS